MLCENLVTGGRAGGRVRMTDLGNKARWRVTQAYRISLTTGAPHPCLLLLATGWDKALTSPCNLRHSASSGSSVWSLRTKILCQEARRQQAEKKWCCLPDHAVYCWTTLAGLWRTPDRWSGSATENR